MNSLFPAPPSPSVRPWKRESYTGDAVISPDGVYRYLLTRSWDGGDTDALVLIGLNPSKAAALDEKGRPIDDPTIRRCVDFADQMGLTRIVMLNACAYRATEPGEMLAAKDPVGPLNDHYIGGVLAGVPFAVCAWTDHVTTARRDAVLEMFSEWGCEPYVFGLTKGGAPSHPLYLKREMRPRPWTEAPR